ncbi:MAG: histidinol-phosphate transaminase [Eubacteriales bacterium]|nr:histidinol-phosphate transaminase [Eubacteriales bacterium]
MSRFLSKRFIDLKPYVPGEQPQDQKYIKLNTNESPYPISEKAAANAKEATTRLQLYPDSDCRGLAERLSQFLNAQNGTFLATENVLLSNGSDEILNFAFMAFCDEKTPAVFPDITYGFYPVFADISNVPYREIPLTDELRIRGEDYVQAGGTIFIANPNAHTGVALSRKEIEEIIKTNPDNVVVVDEAYVDFGAESCVNLIEKYDNLLVIQTFSKSRSMAGARLGFGVGSAELMRDLNTIRNSTNPYNINAMTMAAGIGVLEDEEYTQANCRKIIQTREYVVRELEGMGFTLSESISNFIFMKHSRIEGEWLYEELKKRGVLVRHFHQERIAQYNRVSIGSRQQMEIFITTLGEIVKGRVR